MKPNISRLRFAMRAAMIGASILACLWGGSADATPVSGPEFQIGGTLADAQYTQDIPAITSAGSGYLIVWQDRRGQAGTEYDIYGTFADTNGHATGESFLISSQDGAAAPNNQRTPSVAFNGSTYLVVWADERASNQLSHIYGARIASNGVVMDPNGFAISSVGTAYQTAPKVASNGVDWEVTWQENPVGGSPDIYAARVGAAGTVYTAVHPASTSNNEQNPAIVWNGTNYLVAWEGYATESTGLDISFYRLTSTGALTGSATPVCSAVGDQTHISMAVASNGTTIMTWQDARASDPAPKLDVYGARISIGGAVLDAGGVAINQAANDQMMPSVSWDGVYALVVWKEYTPSRMIRGARITVPVGSNQYIQVMDPNGFNISTSSAGTYGPTVASSGLGNNAVVWYSFGISPVDVSAAKVTSTKSVSAEAVVSLSHQDQPTYASAFDGTNFTTVWSDSRDGVYGIYASRVSQSGAVQDPLGVSVGGFPSGDQMQPAIAWSGTCYLVVWAEGSEAGWTQDLKGIRLRPDLTALDTVPFTITAADNNQNHPAVSWNGTYFLVAWVDYKDGVSPDYWSDVRAARVPASGTVTSGFGTAICTLPGSQTSPSVSSIGGAWMVTWQDEGHVNQGAGDLNPTRAAGIYLARVASTGILQDSTPVLVTSVVSTKETPAIANDGTNYMIIWTDSRNGAQDIYGARIRTNTTRMDVNDIGICTAASVQMNPALAWAGDNYYVAWEDYRSWTTTGANVYAARVSSAGSVVDTGGLMVSGASCPELKPVVSAAAPNWVGVFYDSVVFSVNRLAGRMFGEQSGVSAATIKDAKARANGSWVTLTSIVVTAGTDQLGTGCFYIQDSSRLPGIKVVTSSTVHEADVVTLTGRIDLVDGERQIVASQLTISPAPGTVPKPVAMSSASIGGGPLNQYTPGVTNGWGALNIGLLAKVYGKVTYVGDTGENFFYVDDGRHRNDFSGHIGVKVYCGTAPKPLINKLVTVVGISSCEPSGTWSIRRILARKPQDIVVLL